MTRHDEFVREVVDQHGRGTRPVPASGWGMALASLVTVPPALLLAFFGVNGTGVDPDHSILDLHRYGVAYLVAWLPFVAIPATAVILRRRERMRQPDWQRPGTVPRETSSDGPRAPG